MSVAIITADGHLSLAARKRLPSPAEKSATSFGKEILEAAATLLAIVAGVG